MRSSSQVHRRAKALRRDLSLPEVMLWARLRGRRPDTPTFRRQHPVGPYIADFYCAAARLVVEIDGGGHNDVAQQAHDAARDAYMARLGLTVIRIAAADVMADAEGIAQGMFETARGLSTPRG